ncbi:MAG: phosphomannose isomerase type II C-terminal cupin domain [Candidatus Paceibacterota bacterium]
MKGQPPKPFLDKRPWGEELVFGPEAPSMVKIITVNPGEALSLQYHDNRDEYWRILSGNGIAEIDQEKIALASGLDCFVPRGIKHRLNGGNEPLVLLELAYGVFDENDIVRLEDRYGRK